MHFDVIKPSTVGLDMTSQPHEDLVARSKWVWRETLAIHRRVAETRIASSLSSVDVFVALYYGGVLEFDARAPLGDARDRCVISKGHGSICMYPILADLGFFPKEELERICQHGGILGGIPDPVIPGYETINGSLGHGLGVATGMALGLRAKGNKHSVFVVAGDGEMHEGAMWEAVMLASQHKLDSLTLIIDDNQTSMLGHTRDIIDHVSLADRLSAFGWDCRSVDGHDVEAVRQILIEMKALHDGKPKALIARTLKGHGVPGLENQPLSHILAPKPEVLDRLLEESQ
jgi:transketolase